MISLRRKLFWIFDLLGMLAAFFATGWIAPALQGPLAPGGWLYGQWVETFSPPPGDGIFPPLSQYLWVFSLVAPAAVLAIDTLGGHVPVSRQSPSRILLAATVAPFTGVALLSTVFFLLKTPGYSRLFVVSFAGASSVILCGSRFAGRAWYRYTLREGLHTQEVAIVGTPEAVKRVATAFRTGVAAQEYRLIGYFSLSAGAGPLELEDGTELPLLGQVGDLEDILIHEAIQRVAMVLPSAGVDWLEAAVRACDYFRVTMHIVPEAVLAARLADLASPTNMMPGRIPALNLAPPESRSEWLFVKRVMDVCVSAALLVLLAPVFVLIAIAIKLTTPHLPVLYPWRVVGYRGRRFTGYKFSTMVADADAQRDGLAALNEMSGPVFKIANDPRVTPLGRFLRKYSLNELPQLWSVLKGDMSLVGPRPAGPHELQRYELWHKRKLSAQPGITCLWQVRGRNRISSFDEWVRLDLEYIQSRSFWVDCKILAQTAWVVLRGTGC